jgi:uncharacterized protein YhbP (UPF0306 family)
MPVERSRRRIAAGAMAKVARELLDASELCAIASVAPGGRAYVNTAYFAWEPQFSIVWLSEPQARYSRNIRANKTVAIAVYDSNQSWGGSDRGLQLFGSAEEVEAAGVPEAHALYERRFAEFRHSRLDYRFYRFRPRRLKLFDERVLGAGVFVTARVAHGGRLAWDRTELYRST